MVSPDDDCAPAQNPQTATAAIATTNKIPEIHAALARSHGKKRRIKMASRIPPAIVNILRPSLNRTLSRIVALLSVV